jgi:hypothetical protein
MIKLATHRKMELGGLIVFTTMELQKVTMMKLATYIKREAW